MAKLEVVYEKIVNRKLLTGVQMEIYEILYISGPATVGEIATLYKDRHPRTKRNRSELSKRVSELAASGAVEKSPKLRKCPTTKKKVNVWKFTGKLPVKPPAYEPVKDRLKRLEALEEDVKGVERSIHFALHHTAHLGCLRQTKDYQDLKDFYDKHF